LSTRLGDLVGASKPIQEIMRLISIAATSTVPVLITGETGTGKEVVAHSIHKLSPRAMQPFIAIGCWGTSDRSVEGELFGNENISLKATVHNRVGCLELANGGTVLLDEIDALPTPTQARLVRILEDRMIRRLGKQISLDVRVLATTQLDLSQAKAENRLRDDLYYLVKDFNINVPPLREHIEDIPLLVEHFLQGVNANERRRVRGINNEVLNLFYEYSWPGNVRELRATIERATVACDSDIIKRQDLPAEFGHKPMAAPSGLSEMRFPLGTTVEKIERELILQTLTATKNNKTRAAELLGISLKTLHNKLKIYGAQAK